MKQSRKIIRSMQRIIPEWMRCFARTVIKAVRGVSQAAKKAGKLIQNSKFRIRNCVGALSAATRTHSREWSAALLAAGLVVSLQGGVQAVDANQLPAGEQNKVNVEVTRPEAGKMEVALDATQNKGSVDWQTYSVGADAKVNYDMAHANDAILNRVIGNEMSEIAGQITSVHNGVVQGQVVLVNQNGILFSRGSQVNVGSLVAQTVDLPQADFMAGNYRGARLVAVESDIVIEQPQATEAITISNGEIVLTAAEGVITGSQSNITGSNSGITTGNSQIQTGTISAASGSLTLASAGTAENQTVVVTAGAGEGETLSATPGITMNGAITAGDVTLTTGGDVLQDEGSVTAASVYIAAAQVNLAGNANMISGFSVDAGDVYLRNNRDLAIGNSVAESIRIDNASNITQSGDIEAESLSLVAEGEDAGIVLTSEGKKVVVEEFTAIADGVVSSENTANDFGNVKVLAKNVKLVDVNDINIAQISNAFGAAESVNITAGGNVTQNGQIVANALVVTAGGNIDLSTVENNVAAATLLTGQRDNSDSWQGISFVNKSGVGFAAGGDGQAVRGSTINIVTGGDISQTGAIIAKKLCVQGAAINLLDTGNVISSLVVDADDFFLADATDVTISGKVNGLFSVDTTGAADGSGAVTIGADGITIPHNESQSGELMISAKGDISADGLISADLAKIYSFGGDVTLDNTAHSIGAVSLNGNTVKYTGNGDVLLNDLGADTAVITSDGGGIRQNGTFASVGDLTLLADFAVMTDGSNSISNVTATKSDGTAMSSLELYNRTDINLRKIKAESLKIGSGGNITQSNSAGEAIDTRKLEIGAEIDHYANTGEVTLLNAENSIDKFVVKAKDAYLANSTAITISGRVEGSFTVDTTNAQNGGSVTVGEEGLVVRYDGHQVGDFRVSAKGAITANGIIDTDQASLWSMNDSDVTIAAIGGEVHKIDLLNARAGNLVFNGIGTYESADSENYIALGDITAGKAVITSETGIVANGSLSADESDITAKSGNLSVLYGNGKVGNVTAQEGDITLKFEKSGVFGGAVTGKKLLVRIDGASDESGTLTQTANSVIDVEEASFSAGTTSWLKTSAYITLDNTENKIRKVSTYETMLNKSSLSVASSTDMEIGTIAMKEGQLSVKSAGNISQSGAITTVKIIANAADTVNLITEGNKIKELIAEANDVFIKNDVDITVSGKASGLFSVDTTGAADGSGAVTVGAGGITIPHTESQSGEFMISAKGDIAADGLISADLSKLYSFGGDVKLDNTAHKIGVMGITGNTAKYTGSGDFALNELVADNATIISEGGSISQVGNSSVTNKLNVIARDGDIGLVFGGDNVLGEVICKKLSMYAQDKSVTQSADGVITADEAEFSGGYSLPWASGSGYFVLENTGNKISKISTSTAKMLNQSSLSVASSTDVEIGKIEMEKGQFSIKSAGNISQSGQIVTNSLVVNAAGGIDLSTVENKISRAVLLTGEDNDPDTYSDINIVNAGELTIAGEEEEEETILRGNRVSVVNNGKINIGATGSVNILAVKNISFEGSEIATNGIVVAQYYQQDEIGYYGNMLFKSDAYMFGQDENDRLRAEVITLLNRTPGKEIVVLGNKEGAISMNLTEGVVNGAIVALNIGGVLNDEKGLVETNCGDITIGGDLTGLYGTQGVYRNLYLLGNGAININAEQTVADPDTIRLNMMIAGRSVNINNSVGEVPWMYIAPLQGMDMTIGSKDSGKSGVILSADELKRLHTPNLTLGALEGITEEDEQPPVVTLANKITCDSAYTEDAQKRLKLESVDGIEINADIALNDGSYSCLLLISKGDIIQNHGEVDGFGMAGQIAATTGIFESANGDVILTGEGNSFSKISAKGKNVEIVSANTGDLVIGAGDADYGIVASGSSKIRAAGNVLQQKAVSAESIELKASKAITTGSLTAEKNIMILADGDIALSGAILSEAGTVFVSSGIEKSMVVDGSVNAAVNAQLSTGMYGKLTVTKNGDISAGEMVVLTADKIDMDDAGNISSRNDEGHGGIAIKRAYTGGGVLIGAEGQAQYDLSISQKAIDRMNANGGWLYISDAGLNKNEAEIVGDFAIDSKKFGGLGIVGFGSISQKSGTSLQTDKLRVKSVFGANLSSSQNCIAEVEAVGKLTLANNKSLCIGFDDGGSDPGIQGGTVTLKVANGGISQRKSIAGQDESTAELSVEAAGDIVLYAQGSDGELIFNKVSRFSAQTASGRIDLLNGSELIVGNVTANKLWLGSKQNLRVDENASITGATVNLFSNANIQVDGKITANIYEATAGGDYISSVMPDVSGYARVYLNTVQNNKADAMKAVYKPWYNYDGNEGSVGAGNRFVYAQSATLALTADDKTKTAQTANPPLTYSVAGWLGGGAEGQSSAVLSTSATTGSPSGTYSINIAGGWTDYNYKFGYVPGILTVTPNQTYDNAVQSAIQAVNAANQTVVSAQQVKTGSPVVSEAAARAAGNPVLAAEQQTDGLLILPAVEPGGAVVDVQASDAGKRPAWLFEESFPNKEPGTGQQEAQDIIKKNRS